MVHLVRRRTMWVVRTVVVEHALAALETVSYAR